MRTGSRECGQAIASRDQFRLQCKLLVERMLPLCFALCAQRRDLLLGALHKGNRRIVAFGQHRDLMFRCCDLRSGFDCGRFEALASRRYPRRGDVSARTGLTVHRGTENHSDRSRAVLILGVVSADVPPEETEVHDLTVTPGYLAGLPPVVRDHLRCRVVDRLEPIVQKHTIEGLVMGEP